MCSKELSAHVCVVADGFSEQHKDMSRRTTLCRGSEQSGGVTTSVRTCSIEPKEIRVLFFVYMSL